MGKIVISDNVSIDGVDQDPTGEEGFRHGGWFAQVGDTDPRISAVTPRRQRPVRSPRRNKGPQTAGLQAVPT